MHNKLPPQRIHGHDSDICPQNTRASCQAASRCGMAPASHPAADPSNASWEQRRRSQAPPASPTKSSVSREIPPTLQVASSACCHQGGDCGVSGPGPAHWGTASTTRLPGHSTPSLLCPQSPCCRPHTQTLDRKRMCTHAQRAKSVKRDWMALQRNNTDPDSAVFQLRFLHTVNNVFNIVLNECTLHWF